VRWSGAGIHSGLASSVRLLPRRPGDGITFSFGGRVYGIAEADIDGSRRNTSLVFPGGERLATTEHLLSAIAGTGLDDVLIEPEGEELPILDGSARVFADGIVSCGFEEFEAEYAPPALCVPVCESEGRSVITAVPSEELRITYVIDYPGTPIGTEMKDSVITPEVFMADLAPARTFCLASEAWALRDAGLGRGGDENCVLVVNDGEPRGSGYRVECECAAHKAADLLGDLTLAGFVANAHYICVCGGHRLHAKLAGRLRNSAATNIGR
jgi:UDP-3-O-[3-hydroxymyristoyl] N-acetylglucosamine deacetylase